MEFILTISPKQVPQPHQGAGVQMSTTGPYNNTTCHDMMTSSNGNVFRVNSPLRGKFIGHRWIPLHKGPCRGALMFSLICAWPNGWVNNREAGDLKCHRPHYNAIVMIWLWSCYSISKEICTRVLLCCALLWLYIDWFSHIHQAYFTGTGAI